MDSKKNNRNTKEIPVNRNQQHANKRKSRPKSVPVKHTTAEVCSSSDVINIFNNENEAALRNIRNMAVASRVVNKENLIPKANVSDEMVMSALSSAYTSSKMAPMQSNEQKVIRSKKIFDMAMNDVYGKITGSNLAETNQVVTSQSRPLQQLQPIASFSQNIKIRPKPVQAITCNKRRVHEEPQPLPTMSSSDLDAFFHDLGEIIQEDYIDEEAKKITGSTLPVLFDVSSVIDVPDDAFNGIMDVSDLFNTARYPKLDKAKENVKSSKQGRKKSNKKQGRKNSSRK